MGLLRQTLYGFHAVAGRLYQGKPSDMWALGVLLYTMLYGQFPFYDNTPHELFRKIKAVEYSIPEYVTFSHQTRREPQWGPGNILAGMRSGEQARILNTGCSKKVAP